MPSLRQRTPVDLIHNANAGRLAPLLALKYQRMCVSPFTFLRGAAPVMAYDLSLITSTGIETQLCGDAHVQNLGAYEGPDGRLIFDINDFDETCRGPFEWDVKRMAVSLLVAGQEADLGKGSRLRAVETFLGSYCELAGTLAHMPILEAARYQVRRLQGLASISRVLRKAERATPLRLRDRLMMLEKDGYIFRHEPPLLHRVLDEEREAVLAALAEYLESLQPERRRFFSQFTVHDVGFKVVGTGSIGLRDYLVYLEGNGPDDPLVLQIKEEAPSAYAPYLAVGDGHQGRRVVEGQRAMQLQSDPLLGWTTLAGRDYLVRQLNDHKAAIDITELNGAELREYAGVCGEMLARGHARSGDARALAGYLGDDRRFRAAVLAFAEAYAAQTVEDWKRFTSELKHL